MPTKPTERQPHRQRPLVSRWTRNRDRMMGPGGEAPPTADYVVTGTLTPDATGNYFETGTYDGQPYYKHEDLDYWIWWYDPSMWIISDVLGGESGFYWYKTAQPITGYYTAGGTATGTATIATP